MTLPIKRKRKQVQKALESECATFTSDLEETLNQKPG